MQTNTMKDTLRKLALFTLSACLTFPAVAAYNPRTVTLKARSESMAADDEDFAGDIVVPENEKVTFKIKHNGNAGIYDKVEITVAKKNGSGAEVECFHHAETAVDSSAMPTFEWDTGSADPELSDGTSGPDPSPGAYTAYAKLYKDGTDPLKYSRTTTQCKVHLGPKLEITEGPEYLFANATFWTTVKYRVFTGDSSALSVTVLNLGTPELIDKTGDLKIVDQYVTEKIREETDDHGNKWTAFETYINPECYSGITLSKDFSSSTQIQLTALGGTIEDTWKIGTFVDSTVAAVDIHSDANVYEVKNSAFFIGEGVHNWKLVREGNDFPFGYPDAVSGPNWKMYHPLEEIQHYTSSTECAYVWDGTDYEGGPQYSDYEQIDPATLRYTTGSPTADFFKNCEIDSGYDSENSQLYAHVKMMQTGKNDDYGEFLGAADEIMCGLRFGISYGGKKKTVEGKTFTAMDYKKTLAADCSVDGFEYTVTINETQPIDEGNTLSFEKFLWGGTLAITVAATFPAAWPAWVTAAVMTGGEGVWQLVEATASPEPDEPGRAHAEAWGLRLVGKLSDLHPDADCVSECLQPRPIGNFRCEYENGSSDLELNYGFPELQLNTGNIIGVANQTTARVQIQSKDTHFGRSDVFGVANVTISDFKFTSANDPNKILAPGTVRVKCIE